MPIPQASLEKACLAAFAAQFGEHATWCALAPGRVNIIGEHLDYNDGFVLPAAIDRHVVMAAGPCEGREIRLRAGAFPGEEVRLPLSLPLHPGRPTWANYLRGVLAGFLERGIPVSQGLDVWIESDIPLGGGLSSSAALEVAFATLLEEVIGMRLPPHEKAKLCQIAEQRFAGVPCGVMDQFASTLSREDHLLLIDCQSEMAETVPFSNDGVAFLIANTNVSHALGTSEYPRRREECMEALKILERRSWRDLSLDDVHHQKAALGDKLFRRARHVVTETARTVQAVQKIKSQDWNGLGKLMFASHDSLRNDYEVSCMELDALVGIGNELKTEGAGLLGARMTGGGFGGCTVSLIEADRAEVIQEVLAKRYHELTSRDVSLFLTKPSNGACCLALESGPLRSTARSPMAR